MHLEHAGFAIPGISQRSYARDTAEPAVPLADIDDFDAAILLSCRVSGLHLSWPKGGEGRPWSQPTLTEYWAWMHLQPAVKVAKVPATWYQVPAYESKVKPSSATG